MIRQGGTHMKRCPSSHHFPSQPWISRGLQHIRWHSNCSPAQNVLHWIIHRKSATNVVTEVTLILLQRFLSSSLQQLVIHHTCS